MSTGKGVAKQTVVCPFNRLMQIYVANIHNSCYTMTSVSRPIVKVQKNHTIEIKIVIQFTKCIYIYAHFFNIQETVLVCRKMDHG